MINKLINKIEYLIDEHIIGDIGVVEEQDLINFEYELEKLITTLIQKEREEAVRGFWNKKIKKFLVKSSCWLDGIEDTYYHMVPETYERIEQHLSQTKGGKDD